MGWSSGGKQEYINYTVKHNSNDHAYPWTHDQAGTWDTANGSREAYYVKVIS